MIKDISYLPLPIKAKILRFYKLSIGFILLTLFLLIFPTTRAIFFYPLFLAASIFFMGFFQYRSIQKNGYIATEYLIEAKTGIYEKLLSGIDLKIINDNNNNNIYHLKLTGKNDHPEVGWKVVVYTKPNYEPYYMNGKYIIADYYAKEYQV